MQTPPSSTRPFAAFMRGIGASRGLPAPRCPVPLAFPLPYFPLPPFPPPPPSSSSSSSSSFTNSSLQGRVVGPKGSLEGLGLGGLLGGGHLAGLPVRAAGLAEEGRHHLHTREADVAAVAVASSSAAAAAARRIGQREENPALERRWRAWEGAAWRLRAQMKQPLLPPRLTLTLTLTQTQTQTQTGWAPGPHA